jgi:hypothetical protein
MSSSTSLPSSFVTVALYGSLKTCAGGGACAKRGRVECLTTEFEGVAAVTRRSQDPRSVRAPQGPGTGRIGKRCDRIFH